MPANELAVRAAGVVARQEPTVLDLIRDLATDDRVSVEKLAGLMQLQERAEARDAQREYTAAFARLQLALPRVTKGGKIDLGKGKPIAFAKWEDVDTEIRPILAEHGFSLNFPTRMEGVTLIMACVLSHVGGHSERAEAPVAADTGPGRNALQAVGSGRSYVKRYLTLDMLNIVTEGQDDDGRATGFVTDRQADSISDMLHETGIDADPARMSKFLTFAGAKVVSEIYASEYRRVITALEAERRKGRS